MEYIYTSFVFIVSIIEAALFYHVICRRKIVEIAYKQLLPFVGLYVVQMFLVGFQARGLLQNILIALLYYLVGVFLTGTNWFQNIKYWMISLFLSAVLEEVIYLSIWQHFFPKEEGYGIGNIYTCITVVIVLYIINKFLKTKIGEEEINVPKTSRIMLPVICGVIFAISYMIYAMDQTENEEQKFFAYIILLVAILGIGIIVVMLLHISQQKENFKLQAELENRYNEQQKAYFMMMFEQQEETKRFRHDILNHLICIQDQMRRGHYLEAETYVSNVLNNLDAIRGMQYDVGNEVVNVLLNYYLLPVREQCNIGIDGYLGNLEHISQMDLCTIISNLLKNAVEAVDKDGEIAVHIVRKEKYVQVDIHNSCKTMPQISRMEEIKTSKADKENHGYGLDNVKKTVEKNHGKFQYYVKGTWFYTETILLI